MKIAVEWHKTSRGTTTYTVNEADLPEGFWDWRGYEQQDWLDSLNLNPEEVEHRADYETGDIWEINAD